MVTGGKAALLVSCLTVAGCSADVQQVKVRPIADPGAAFRNGGDAVAVARGQLLLGNVGLALEGFRTAQRDNPSDPSALAGIADCYAAMSRYDLAQSNYEAALALAPHDRLLLLGLANAFEREGKIASAMAARAEANASLPPAPAIAKQAAAPQLASKARPLAAVKPQVEVKPVPAVPIQAVPELHRWADARPPQVRIESAPLATRQAALLPMTTPDFVFEAPPAPAPAARPAQPIAQAPAATPTAGIGSITVPLPPARPVEHFEMHAAPMKVARVEYDYSGLSSSVTVPLPPVRPAPVDVAPPAPRPAPMPIEAAAFAQAPSPRLERLSLGEVALVTTGKPIWTAVRDVQTASVGGLQWVSLASFNARPNVQILNAARTDRLAASARTVLLNRGWHKIAVGDAPAVQIKSEVQYPRNQATLGRRLAAQFGVAARMVERDVLLLVLGRDAVGKVARPQKS